MAPNKPPLERKKSPMPGKGLTAGRVRRLQLVLTTISVLAVTVLVGAGFAGTELASASSSRMGQGQTLHGARKAHDARITRGARATTRIAPERLVRAPALSDGSAPQSATYLGAEPATSSLEVDLVLAPSNVSELPQFVSSVSSPASPLYHQYLTEPQFVAEFGPPSGAAAEAESWLRSDGLTVSAESPFVITASGTAGAVASAFGVQFGRYETSGGVSGVVASGAPLLPADLAAGEVSGVVGLNTLDAPQDFSARPVPGGAAAPLNDVGGASSPGTPAAGAAPGAPGSPLSRRARPQHAQRRRRQLPASGPTRRTSSRRTIS